ncbi:hypothetical protein CK203_081408 [Vitis vinifera]|uniref:Retroviral polymerase SH3-like domain-containing protein n=1 Tax=Vitis vinifera TaxID=29760 RepID=A0A438DG70_VITVI|nr:hypothetical protein CK203_081408 [Vitis vinifera]
MVHSVPANRSNVPANRSKVRKLTKDLNCTAKFFPSCCEFQDLSSGRTIRKAGECDRLYYYEDSAVENGQSNVAAPGRSKLEPRAIKCVLLGYPSTKHGYKCF